MKMVVFGGSGFLGSHVADALTDSGQSVVIYDVKESPYLREGQLMQVGDILDFEKVLSAVKGSDYVYNFAGIADLDDATTKPLDTIHLNIVGNANILEASRLASIKRYIYASTIYVYSQKGGFYRCSKQASELYIEEYRRRFGLNFTILRYGTLYGQRADHKNSIFRYLKQALEKGRIKCTGTGDEVREYIYVKDAARLSLDVLDKQFEDSHVIISGYHAMKLSDMLKMIGEILNKEIKIDYDNKENFNHYIYTPYSYSPRIGHKLVSDRYLDMGQGLLECIQEMDRIIHNQENG
ncbi:MAG: NAD(P)-dependent oxidoreductase [Candidatus Eremiobacteraeota bacterium]|nr:NAD(P)-dependent oxidoreductase [Candidatus Eremiobacteraeota bacterium]